MSQGGPTGVNVPPAEPLRTADVQARQAIAPPSQNAPPTQVRAEERMSPVIGEGVRLARFVLWIAASTIVMLVGYLVYMDFTVGRDVERTYAQILNPSRIGSQLHTLGRLEAFGQQLQDARKSAEFRMLEEAASDAGSLIQDLDRLPALTVAQKGALHACLPLPNDESRVAKLDRCIALLENVREAALAAAGAVTNVQAAADSVGRMYEQRQGLHAFWLQAAQLVLLNLLLPLLTALFGYIFGTQQASRPQSSG